MTLQATREEIEVVMAWLEIREYGSVSIIEGVWEIEAVGLLGLPPDDARRFAKSFSGKSFDEVIIVAARFIGGEQQ